jgi:hypothetical protein
MSKEELAVNVACSMGQTRQQGEWPSGLNGSDKFIEMSREECPDKSGKSPVTLSKEPPIGREGIELLRDS